MIKKLVLLLSLSVLGLGRGDLVDNPSLGPGDLNSRDAGLLPRSSSGIRSLAGASLAPRRMLMSAPNKASSYRFQHDGRHQLEKRQTQTTPADTRPTPEPTGASSALTTVHIIDEDDFALLLPDRPGELISDAESDGVSYCTPASTDSACQRRVQDGFIRAAAVTTADDGSYIQVWTLKPCFIVVALCEVPVPYGSYGVFLNTPLKQLRRRNPSDPTLLLPPHLRSLSAPKTPHPHVHQLPPSQSRPSSRLIGPASEFTSAPDPSLLPDPIFPVAEQSSPAPDSTPVPGYAIRTTNCLVAVEPEIAENLGLEPISRSNNELPENATFDELIDKVREYAGYFELYVRLCNEPPEPYRIPDDSVAVSILRANRIAELYRINPAYLRVFATYPCYTFHIINQLTEALRNDRQLPYGNFDYPFHYNHSAIIQYFELTDPRYALDIHFLPPNDPFHVEYPLRARFEFTRQRGRYIQPVLSILYGVDETIHIATFTESGLANRLVFENLKAEIRLALCLYLIDPRDWCTRIHASGKRPGDKEYRDFYYDEDKDEVRLCDTEICPNRASFPKEDSFSDIPLRHQLRYRLKAIEEPPPRPPTPLPQDFANLFPEFAPEPAPKPELTVEDVIRSPEYSAFNSPVTPAPPRLPPLTSQTASPAPNSPVLPRPTLNPVTLSSVTLKLSSLKTSMNRELVSIQLLALACRR
ncbi:hypothetical protein ONZ51_g4503 [Trametes cubensis]|uniref:Uncharacterized protein n=1 Tax=Trametes cubensis TaxID=1111947 RepID=A0AAD7TWR6_9APHY|nr:hypothetical protein ONZ51_g4503 [Trametes cubensis]